MNMNPLQLMNILKNKNPQELIISMIGNQNPMINNLMQLAKSGNKTEIENIARNMCKEKGIDFDKQFAEFMKQING